MRAFSHSRTACFETRAAGALLSMRGAENGENKPPHAEEARSAVSKHAVGFSSVGIAIAAALSSPAALAKDAPNLAEYNCTRPDDSQGTGEQLAAEGYVIGTMARFGDFNLMMVKPNTDAIANCFKRQGGQN